MLSLRARPTIGRVLDPIARLLVRLGWRADAITIVGTLGVVAGALAFYPRGHFLAGTLVITAFVFSDLIDGAVARAGGSSGPWGAFLDSTMDRFGDGAIFATLALWFAGGGHSWLLAAVAIYDLVTGSVTSYIKARAESLGLSCNVGWVERSERLIVILVATGLTGIFNLPVLEIIALWGLAVGSTITVGQRLVEVRRQARAAGAPVAGAQAAAPPARPATS
ncbi:MAG: phosphatidylinositol phosphate synthase [Mycobacteriales bacterium]